jgi:hypothetical protein
MANFVMCFAAAMAAAAFFVNPVSALALGIAPGNPALRAAAMKTVACYAPAREARTEVRTIR